MSVGVGVIGAGMMGLDHVRTLTSAVDGAHVAAVADADPARAEAAAALGGGRAVADPPAPIAHAAGDRGGGAAIDTTPQEVVLARIGAGQPGRWGKPPPPTPQARRPP